MTLSAGKVLTFVLLISLTLLHGCLIVPELIRTGKVSIRVIDEFQKPVADVEITLNPVTLVGKTDVDGTVAFIVLPGEYFVDSSICCVGPGFIQYHVPVTVKINETVTVELKACLSCD